MDSRRTRTRLGRVCSSGSDPWRARRSEGVFKEFADSGHRTLVSLLGTPALLGLVVFSMISGRMARDRTRAAPAARRPTRRGRGTTVGHSPSALVLGLAVEPVTADAAKARSVQAMFTRIARRYDRMNTLMTFGRHHAWRRVVARATMVAPEGPALDLATGTGDLALAIAGITPGRAVVGADFSETMLSEARRKIGRTSARIALIAADALQLPFPDATFACVTSAFLLRNLADLEAGLLEMRRVTRSGGRVVALEITQPSLPVFSAVFGVYFHRVVPAIGAMIAGDRAAYTYLPDSVARFVSPDELGRIMRGVGFKSVGYRRVGLGTVAIHAGTV